MLFPIEKYKHIPNFACLDSNTYKSFDTLALAKVECSEDDACVAVTDKFCNNEGLKLCKSLTTSRFDSDCIYKKEELHGIL